MSDFDDDPYAGEFQPVAPQKAGGRKTARAAMMPGDPGEGVDVDNYLAFQPMNDFGNAQRLKVRFGDDLMFVENIGWFVWDGVRWNRESGQSEAFRRGHRIAQAIIEEAKALEQNPGKMKAEAAQARVDRLFGWSVQTGNTARIHGMLTSAAPYLEQKVDDLDCDAFLVACQNGTIELGLHSEFRESRRADRITRSLGVKYKSGAECPIFLRFLEEVMPDEDMRAFLQRIFGYCLTGSTREHKMFIFYGTGRNGKSTLMNVIRHVIGDYAASTPVATFLAKRDGNSGGEASPDLARLPGARLVTASEPPEGGRLDESRVKEMTGGDTMTVRHLNQGFFEFRPKFKLCVPTNYRPAIRGTDHGIWARMLLVPFTVQIADDRIDRNLEAKLLAEAEGILQWMLTGAEDWFAIGLKPPAKAIAAVEAYRADEDPVGEFLKAKCDQYPIDYINPGTERPWETSQKRLREIYLEWCKEEGLDPMGAKAFGSKLTGRGIQRRKSNGLTFYQGVVVKADPLPGGQG